jgi:hypothetical protein
VHGYGQIKIAAMKKNEKPSARSAERAGRRLRKPDGQIKRRQRQRGQEPMADGIEAAPRRRLTLEEIEAGRSPAGGWTRATLAFGRLSTLS